MLSKIAIGVAAGFRRSISLRRMTEMASATRMISTMMKTAVGMIADLAMSTGSAVPMTGGSEAMIDTSVTRSLAQIERDRPYYAMSLTEHLTHPHCG
ncbi:MAG: hypothetical protein ACLPXZ_20770 [Mycobacterium sp.]